MERVEWGNGSEGEGRERRGGEDKGRETGDEEIELNPSGEICLSSILTILRAVSVSELEGGRTTESCRPMLVESHFCSPSLKTLSTVTVRTIELEGTIGGEERVGVRERVRGEVERVGESEDEDGDEGDKGDDGDFEGEG